MTERNKVVWSEGLFLRTQHFQQQDRYAEGLLLAALRASPMHPYGFSSLELDRAALDAGRISVLRGDGLFPDGTPFSIPSDCLAPAPVGLKPGSGHGVVCLAIPALRPGTVTIDPSYAEATGARYKGRLVQTCDTVRSGTAVEEIEVAALATKLIVPGDDAAGFITMPLARVDGLRADGSVALVEGFLAPALTIKAVPWYSGLLLELVTGLERIAEAHGGMVIGGTGRSVDNLLILELANTARPLLAHVLAQNCEHPATLFGELASLAGRMATYGASSRRLSDLPAYDHMDPQPAYAALAEVLRSLLLTLRHVEPKARAMPVARHSQNVWKVRIDNSEILRTSRIVLRVGSEMSEESLRKIFVSQATVGSADTFETLWKSRLPGIALKPLHTQPREIPYDGERLCLELDQKSEHWAELLDAPGFVIGVSGQLDREPEIDCFAVTR